MEQKTDKWTFDQVGRFLSLEDGGWTDDTSKPIRFIKRKVILVPRIAKVNNRATYRVLDMFRPTAKPYLSCFDEENIPPYPVENMLVWVHGYNNICKVLSVDDQARTCVIAELNKIPRTSSYYEKESPRESKVEMRYVRRQPKGTWDEDANPPLFHENIIDEHLPGDWDAMVEQEDPEQPTPVPEISAAMQPGAPPA